jgi:hypothetical protein
MFNDDGTARAGVFGHMDDVALAGVVGVGQELVQPGQGQRVEGGADF